MIDCHVLSLFCRFLIFCFSTKQKLFPPQAAKTFKIFNQVTLRSLALLKHASSSVPSCTFRNLPSASFHFIFVLKILIDCLRMPQSRHAHGSPLTLCCPRWSGKSIATLLPFQFRCNNGECAPLLYDKKLIISPELCTETC